MAILQVNVRPAALARRRDRAQRGGQAGEFGAQVSQLHYAGPTQAPPHSAPRDAAPFDDPMPPLPAEDTIWQPIVWRLTPGTPVGRALVSATERLRDAGSATASLDAQVILAHVLGVERSWLFAHHDHILTERQAETYTELIARRMTNEPVAYIVGHKEFYGLDLVVDRRVLVPRPETELLVDAALDRIHVRDGRSVRIADVGTGSGAIAIAIAANCAQAQVDATDISADALEVARVNVQRLGVEGQVRLLCGNLLAPLTEPVEIIVANLPYISTATYPTLDADVRSYEPRIALEAGATGLEVIHRLLQQAPLYLQPGGVILIEIGYDQGKAVLDLVRRTLPQARHVDIHADYHGHDRVVMIIL